MEWLAKVMTTGGGGGGVEAGGLVGDGEGRGSECISILALSFRFGATLPFANG